MKDASALAQATAAQIPLRDESVHCIVTSPPYYRQRAYKVDSYWPPIAFRPNRYLDEHWVASEWRGELGWEPHPLDFVGHLVMVFRECYRVLREDGTLWLNISDKRTDDRQWHSVPEMLLAALVADGWRHEDTVLWRKKNCMPSSQTNRFTRDFEKVYMLNKSTASFFDIDAAREQTGREASWEEYSDMLGQDWADYELDQAEGRGHCDGATAPPTKRKAPTMTHPNGRTRRTTWDVTTKGTDLDHYAAFPPDLVTPMLKSSLSEYGTCPQCNAPWGRVVERMRKPGGRSGNDVYTGHAYDRPQSAVWGSQKNLGGEGRTVETVAWYPTCSCYPPPERGPVQCPKCKGTGREMRSGGQQWIPDGVQYDNHNRSGGVSKIKPIETGNPCPHCSGAGTVEGDIWPDDINTWATAPSVVLDPFAGTATVAEALRGLQIGGAYPARFVGLDLNHRYLADLARERLGLHDLARWQGTDPMPGGDWRGAGPLFDLT